MMSNGSYCMVVNCKKNKKEHPELAFFSLPKKMEIAQKWVEFSGRKDIDMSKSAHYICSEHFSAKQIKTHYPRKLLYVGSIPFLKGIHTNESAESINENVASNSVDVHTGVTPKGIKLKNIGELSNGRVAGQKNESEGDIEPFSLKFGEPEEIVSECTPVVMTESNEYLKVVKEELNDADSEYIENNGWDENCVHNSSKHTSENVNIGVGLKKRKYEAFNDEMSELAALKKYTEEKKDELAEEHSKKMEILEELRIMQITFLEEEQRKRMELLEEERIKRMTLLQEEHKKRLELLQENSHVERQYIEQQNKMKQNILLLEQQILVKKLKKK